MRLLTPLLAATTFGVCLLFLSHVAAQSRTGKQVQEALSEQDAWLNGQQYAAGWNHYLQTPSLKEQLDKGAAADPKVVRSVLGKYQAREPGLRLPPFATTRKALTDWLNELSEPKLSDLSALARAAKSDFKPVAKADVLGRQVALDAAVRRLDRYLKNSGPNGEGWRKYLGLPDLQAELNKELNADPKVLNALAEHFVSGVSGLELPQFTGVANTLRPYIDLLGAYQNSDAQAAYGKNLDALADALDAAAKQPNNFDRRQLGELVNRIAASGQAPALVAAIHGQFDQPNLLVRASKYFVARANDDQTLQKHMPVNDVILGTDVCGWRDSTARWTTALVPNRDRAEMHITLSGIAKSKTVGYHGIVTVFSHGNTSLYGQKSIFLDASGNTSDAACAQCCTDNNIDCIDVCAGPLITRFATKRVYASKGEAEAIASDHAAGQVEQQMDKKATESLANSNRRFDVKFRNPLLQRGAFPQQLAYSTTADWLNVDGLQARPNELGAAVDPPNVASDDQLSIRVHESFVENMCAAVLPGRSIRGMAYRRWMRDQSGERYERDEFNDLLLCLSEAAAEKPDKALVVPFDQFQTLMKNLYGADVTEADYHSLAGALYHGSLTQDQFDRYLSGIPRETVSYDEVMKFLAAAKRGDAQVDYSAMTFDKERPVSIQFRDGTARLTLRITDLTAPNLDPDGKRISRECPAEIFVTYRLKLNDSVAELTRVEGEYGINSLPLPPEVEANISSLRKTALYNRRRKTLPLRFFGEGSKPKIDGQIASEPLSREKSESEEAPKGNTATNPEPIFPQALPQNHGLEFRGDLARKMNNLPCPWAQLTAQDGWLALGWTLPEQRPAAESTSTSKTDVQ
jgi:hypothetical protein